MPQQFVVPQFIETEDHIFGPITARQFIILMIMGLVDFTLFKLLSFTMFLVFGIPIFAIGTTFAFARINGQAFHFFVLNIIQTFKKPKIRVWEKTYTNAQLKEYIGEALPELPTPMVHKAPLSSSRLNEISLVVNTGGVYKPEED